MKLPRQYPYVAEMLARGEFSLREFDEHVKTCKTCQAILALVERDLADAFGMDELSLAEASREYGVKHDTLRHACWSKRLPAQKRGGVWFIKREDLEEWLKRYKPKPRKRKENEK